MASRERARFAIFPLSSFVRMSLIQLREAVSEGAVLQAGL